MRRYLIRCDHTGRLLSWSYSLPRALRAAHGLRMRLIPVYVEVAHGAPAPKPNVQSKAL